MTNRLIVKKGMPHCFLEDRTSMKSQLNVLAPLVISYDETVQNTPSKMNTKEVFSVALN